MFSLLSTSPSLDRLWQNPTQSSWSAAVMSWWIFLRAVLKPRLSCYTIHTRSVSTTLFPFIYLYDVFPAATVNGHVTRQRPHRNMVTLKKSPVTTNRAQQEQRTGSRGWRVLQRLTSRRLQYPNLLLPSSPVSMKEKVSLRHKTKGWRHRHADNCKQLNEMLHKTFGAV